MVGTAFLRTCHSDCPCIFSKDPYRDSGSLSPFLSCNDYNHVLHHRHGIGNRRLSPDIVCRPDDPACHTCHFRHKYYAQKTVPIKPTISAVNHPYPKSFRHIQYPVRRKLLYWLFDFYEHSDLHASRKPNAPLLRPPYLQLL